MFTYYWHTEQDTRHANEDIRMLFCLFTDDNSEEINYANVELVLKRGFIAGSVLRSMRRELLG